MDLNSLKTLVDVLTGVLTLVAGTLAALWAYAKFVLERGFLPPAQLDIDCNVIGAQHDQVVLEVLLRLKNLGSSTLIAENVRVDVRYLEDSDQARLISDPTKRSYGKLEFPHRLKTLLGGSVATTDPKPSPAAKSSEERGIRLIRHDTFVQPAVDQAYPLITAVPKQATFVLVWASFEYAQVPSLPQRVVLRVCRALGMVQFTLKHVTEPHTAERAFRVAPE